MQALNLKLEPLALPQIYRGIGGPGRAPIEYAFLAFAAQKMHLLTTFLVLCCAL